MNNFSVVNTTFNDLLKSLTPFQINKINDEEQLINISRNISLAETITLTFSNSTYTFPKAFRKLVLGLRQRGVTTFATVWCYEPDGPGDFADSTAKGWKWYPGDDVVDWFGLDVFPADHFDPSEPDTNRNGLTKKGRSELFMKFAEQRGKPGGTRQNGPAVCRSRRQRVGVDETR